MASEADRAAVLAAFGVTEEQLAEVSPVIDALRALEQNDLAYVLATAGLIDDRHIGPGGAIVGHYVQDDGRAVATKFPH